MVEESRLHPGDEVAIGPLLFRVDLETPPAPHSSAPPRSPPRNPTACPISRLISARWTMTWCRSIDEAPARILHIEFHRHGSVGRDGHPPISRHSPARFRPFLVDRGRGMSNNSSSVRPMAMSSLRSSIRSPRGMARRHLRRRLSMVRNLRLAIGMAITLSVAAGEARAQYYPGYGPVWLGRLGAEAGGSTVQGEHRAGPRLLRRGRGRREPARRPGGLDQRKHDSALEPVHVAIPAGGQPPRVPPPGPPAGPRQQERRRASTSRSGTSPRPETSTTATP